MRLRGTDSYRRGDVAGGRTVVLLRFNQPVRAADIARSLSASLEPHKWTPPAFSAEEQARLKRIDPAALDLFNAKVAATRATASSSVPVPLRQTNDWDKKAFPPSSDLLAFESTTAVAPESWISIRIAPDVRSGAGPATPGKVQHFTVKTPPAFFIHGFRCHTSCGGDARNPITMSAEVKVPDFAASVSAVDITSGERPVAKGAKPKVREDYEGDRGSALTLEDAGFDAQPPNRKYAVTAKADLKSADGQTLGYTWVGVADNWHMRAFTSFGDGHGVWEKDGGGVLPFYARNMRDVTQWVSAILPAQLMPILMKLQDKGFNETPPGPGAPRRIGGTPDRIESHGLDMSRVLQPGGTGLVWTAIREGEPIPRARRYGEPDAQRTKASLIQVTNLGITVKDSPQNTLVFVTRLDTGAPVAAARVSIVRTDNSTFWRGTTGADGIALAPTTPLRDTDDIWKLAFVVMAEKDGDTAYVGSDWNEGISPWEFGTGINLNESVPLLRGTVFTDRGVYRLGEEIHLKAILRHNTPSGVRLLPAGTSVIISVRDSQNRMLDERTVRVNAWSSADWTMTLPKDGALGNYQVRALLESDRPKPRKAAPGSDALDPDQEFESVYQKAVHGSFLVAAYRRPDFRVDVTLSSASAMAGDPLSGIVGARYLFGAPMGTRPVKWSLDKSPRHEAPAAITEKFGDDRWVFVGYSEREGAVVPTSNIRSDAAKLANDGTLPLKLDTKRGAGVPYVYTLEGDVEDVSRQHIANRGSILVHPAPWYVGVRRPSYFLEQKAGLKTEIIAVGIDGTPAAGVPVDVTLTRVQWTSVRRAEGNGFYTWDTERKEIPAGKWTVTTTTDPVALSVPFASGGYFLLEATGRAADGRFAVTRTSFYVLGDGYTAWERFDHNRIELVPERKTYKPGDTARIMIQSPWEKATALVTTEREGIRSHRQFMLTSTQQSISVPIAEGDIPNVFVSVLLVKGRSAPASAAASAPKAAPTEGDASDPGKPAFRLGYVELKVEDRSKRLTVAVAANKEEYRPASTANVNLHVKDHQGRGAASEVTLWAVDYGVLSLTSYRTPDVLGSVYVRKALQVMNADSRQRIVSRRVLTPKGETEGGGGGQADGAGTLRKDFRVLAFWLGSVTTGADGRATVDVKLPESLTTYRIMAVAADRSSRFGSGEAEVRTNKPLTLKPSFPRFLAVGDRAHFGAVVGSQLPAAGTAIVTMKSLDPGGLAFAGPAEQTVAVAAGGSLEIRFDATGKSIGRARVRMTVKIGQETDAFEDVIPVDVLVSPETVAAYGEVAGGASSASETLLVPTGALPGSGGLHVEMASTAMVGLGEGARYLVEYPYGCAEQKGSRALALLLAADLGDAFSLPGMEPAKMRGSVQQALTDLERFQCGTNGGMAYWPGNCASTSPYLTAYLLHVFKVASDMKYRVDPAMRNRAYSYLEEQLAAPPPTNAGWWPSYTAWQAFAVRTLVEGGRNQDSNLNRLYGYRDRMPVFALAYLHDALLGKGETGARVTELRRRMLNAIRVEAGSAHVEELGDPHLLWLWSSNARTTAIVLNSLVKAGVADAPVRQMVRWLMLARTHGRWGNTQENAHAMQALVNYYRKYEPDVPSFRAIAALGAQELAREEFKGRSSESVTKEVPMAQLLAGTPAGTSRPLSFTREGTGTLFYSTRLRYVTDTFPLPALEAGFRVERRYEPFVENGSKPAALAYKAGDLVRVTLTFRLTKERRFVAVTDPLPAGFEAVESWFATTARQLAAQQDRQVAPGGEGADWDSWWRTGGFDHVERHDDRVQLFATRLDEGVHEFSYIVRATTAGTFRTAPARAEEMYTPEIFGRTPSTTIDIKK
ncbi:MAG TPA: MG2 domain-containing protein [Vicinamibacterales bacterium]|nr:MG2 domain-containing protein [Vicinamibacterales bacterium]